MAVWKWGCNFGGMGSPCHLEFLEDNGIVLGDTNWSHYEPDDLVAVAKGVRVIAIVRVVQPPQPITLFPDLHPRAAIYQIAIADHIVVAPVEWRNINAPYHLPIQAGHRQIQKREHVNNITEIWNNIA